MRRLRPTSALEARYPALAAARRILGAAALLAAPLAGADTSVPRPPSPTPVAPTPRQPAPGPTAPAPTPPRPKPPGPSVTPPKRPGGRPDESRRPLIKGAYGGVNLPGHGASSVPNPFGMIIHPHGLGEPCQTIPCSDEEEGSLA